MTALATIALWASLAVAGVSVPPETAAAVLASPGGGWQLRAQVVPDVMWVARHTSVSPFILGSVAWKESGGGRPWLVRYCTHWRSVTGGKSCARQRTCWKDCMRPEVWDNRLDLGLWGIRDAPLPASSWLRRYARVTGKTKAPECPMQRRCARRLMAWMVDDVRKWEVRPCPWPCVGANGWLGRWNGCGPCVAHLHRAMSKELYARVGLAFDKWSHGAATWWRLAIWPRSVQLPPTPASPVVGYDVAVRMGSIPYAGAN